MNKSLIFGQNQISIMFYLQLCHQLLISYSTETWKIGHQISTNHLEKHLELKMHKIHNFCATKSEGLLFGRNKKNK
jgi:hypothetical protein